MILIITWAIIEVLNIMASPCVGNRFSMVFVHSDVQICCASRVCSIPRFCINALAVCPHNIVPFEQFRVKNRFRVIH